MYIIVATCFGFAASNDLFIYPKYMKLKEKYKQFVNQDEYLALNGDQNGGINK